MLTNAELRGILRELFLSWRPYKTILLILQRVHGVRRSLRWLKGQFRLLGLSRRGHNQWTPESMVKHCIRREIRSSNALCGYRRMWTILRDKYQLKVTRNAVMKALREVDPQSSANRACRRIQRRVYISKGPNFSWHIDQYDKLATFGFRIHGCIDGFSRRIMWLKMATTNHDPAVTLGYYLECIGDMKVCPRVIRIDKGTENTLISECQLALRMGHEDSLAGEKSVRVGSSPTNSRIESLWSRLRTLKMEWWIRNLKDLQQNGHYSPDSDTDRQCLAVVLESILQQELLEFLQYWNSHTIRTNTLAECPPGIPNDLYSIPEEFGGDEHGCNVDPNLWMYYSINAKKSPPPFYDDHFYSMCNDAIKAKFSVDLHNGINHSNWLCIYKYLKNNIA